MRASSRPGDLVFDIGAHVGDRVSSFRRLGARVVALSRSAAGRRHRLAAPAYDRQVTSCAPPRGAAPRAR